jgi:hypothetical protein
MLYFQKEAYNMTSSTRHYDSIAIMIKINQINLGSMFRHRWWSTKFIVLLFLSM